MKYADAPKPLNFQQMAEILRDTEYRWPGWEIALYEDPFEGPCAYFSATVVDGYDPEKTTDLGIRSLIPPVYSAEHFLDWMLWRLMQIKSHEVRELFWYKGKPFRDPHDPVVPC